MLQNLDTYSLDIALTKKMLGQDYSLDSNLETMSADDERELDDAMTILQELVEMSELHGSSSFVIKN